MVLQLIMDSLYTVLCNWERLRELHTLNDAFLCYYLNGILKLVLAN